MRVGAYPCEIPEDTLAFKLYGRDMVLERHRHRYEVNPRYHRALADAGLTLSGLSPDGRLAEMIELTEHPFFIASQFHPEFKSRPTRAHPLFRGLIEAGLERQHKSSHAETVVDDETNSLGPQTMDELKRSIA